MNPKIIEAIYENGSFNPLSSINMEIEERERVYLVVEPIEKAEDILAMAAQVYEGLNEDQIDSIEQHSKRREDFFDRKNSS